MRKALGFTLIELIVVIAIIAVLAAVVAPNAFKAIEKAKVSGTIADLSSIKTGTMAYYGDTGQWPTGPIANGSSFVTTDNLPGWDGPYLEKWPAQSKWGGNYTYENDNLTCWNSTSTSPCGTNGRYVQVTSIPGPSQQKIDSQVDGNTSNVNGSVRYPASGTSGPLKYLIATDVSVN